MRLRAAAGRTALRVLLAAMALLFLIGAIVFAHIAVWAWLDRSSLASAGILGGVDLALAVVLGLLASRSTPSAVEIEAAAVRGQALEGLRREIGVLRLGISLLQLLRRRRR